MDPKTQGSEEVGRILPFYSDATVFVTGASGFVGMVLVESLIRKTNVHTIYVLLRSKKDKTAEDRLSEMLGGEIFNKIREERPERLSVVKMMNGDVTSPNLGMNGVDATRAMEQVNIIFHVAASVQFNANIKLAISVNVNGVRNVMEFAKKVKHLKVVMHVSTAYVNEHLTELEEKIYSMEDEMDMEKLAESVSDNTANKITKTVIGKSCNAYIYTKRVTEQMIEKCYSDLPVGILRPGAVLGAIRDPLPGWINNLYGPTGLVIGLMTGKVHVLIAANDSFAEALPVDSVTNCLISAAYDTNYRFQSTVGEYKIPVYNVVSSLQAPITWSNFMKIVVNVARKEPCKSCVWYPFQMTTSYWIVYKTLFFLLHYIHAFIIDRVVARCGCKTRYVQMYQHIDKVLQILYPFCNKPRKLYTQNVQLLWKKMTEEERQLFPFDMEHFQWSQYIPLYLKGIRKFLLNEEENGKSSERKALRLFIYHYSTIILTSCIFIGLLYIIFCL